MQELYQVGLGRPIQKERRDAGIEARTRLAALSVELEHLVQGPMAAVVHVRAGVDHFPQRRHLELALVAPLPGDSGQAEVGRVLVRTDAQAGKLLIGEVVATVALRTFSGALENVQAAPGAGSQRVFVPIQVAVIG